MADYSYILFNKNPEHCAFSERVAGEPTDATGAPAAPLCWRNPQPSRCVQANLFRSARRHRKLRGKPSPHLMRSSPGCDAPKSDSPRTGYADIPCALVDVVVPNPSGDSTVKPPPRR
jgi:hypothetical protein